jgi:hypothetical protein
MTEKSVKGLLDEIASSIDRRALKKWIEEGKPYEDDDDILLIKQLERDHATSTSRSGGISIDSMFW